jgi:hypothetical protein
VLGSFTAAFDPSQLMLRLLRNVGGAPADPPEQVIDGFNSTHYHAELSLGSLADLLPQRQHSQMQHALAFFATLAKINAFSVDVWVDPEHLIRRVVMTLHTSLPGGQTMSGTTTYDFNDYGPQVRPAIPPADQVQSLTQP